MPVHESDVCIIGAGISSAMLAQKLSELRPGLSITIVEAGRSIFDFENRFKYRERMAKYGENPWPGDFIEGQAAAGGISRTMAVGGPGAALGWDMQSIFGRRPAPEIDVRPVHRLAACVDRAREILLRSRTATGRCRRAEPVPGDRRSEPYPMKPIPLTWSLERLKEWGDKSGIPFQATPQAKNTVPYDGRAACIRCGTCDICPTGARYSPDFTFKQLLAEKKIVLHDHTLIRKLMLDDSKNTIVAAQGVHSEHPDQPQEYRAQSLRRGVRLYLEFASCCCLSANSRFPNGIANRAGQVGKYMNGHAFIQAFIELDAEIYPEHESAIRADFAAVLPLRAGRPVCSPRPAHLGERPRSAAAEGSVRPDSAGRRYRQGLARPKSARHGPGSGVLRRPSRPKTAN